MPRFLFAILITFVVNAAEAVPQSDIEAFAAKIETPLRAARYMVDACSPTTIAGWEDYATVRCKYTVTDKKTGATKDGLVVLLNPSSTVLSAWIMNACEAIRPSEPLTNCAQRLFRRVLEQSGGQFPVAGIVYEDILPHDGVQEAYGFSDGVTTLLQGVKHRRTEPFSTAELEAALSAQPIRTASEAAFARLVGVSRAEYLKSNPSTDVTNLNWLAVVRGEHKKAMKSARNALFEAWLAANAP
ncbi:hypothetical protein [Casimicrobium huifangae]|jgi:hypothetical protein|uniref:hypothetical protein n=1 Tax=Casimicrobium huifangae TaxID=2591109 RepID=UPI0012EC5A07|nr:hypothetical protein [Casimicrobium huifangae]